MKVWLRLPALGPGSGSTLDKTEEFLNDILSVHSKKLIKKPGLWIRIRIRMDPHSFSLMDPDPHSICGSGSGSRRVNLSTKN